MSNLKTKIGGSIRELRTKRGMSQEELSAKCGVLRTTISRIENGSYNPSLDILEKILVALEVTMDITD